MRGIERIFQPDEMELRKVSSHWTKDEVLVKEGIFFLKDLDDVLSLNRIVLFKKWREIQAIGKDPWQVMGIRKVWNHWQVRMKIFAPFYQEYLDQSQILATEK